MLIILLAIKRENYMDRKASYEEVELEVVSFEAEDVIVTSPTLESYEGEITP